MTNEEPWHDRSAMQARFGLFWACILVLAFSGVRVSSRTGWPAAHVARPHPCIMLFAQPAECTVASLPAPCAGGGRGGVEQGAAAHPWRHPSGHAGLDCRLLWRAAGPPLLQVRPSCADTTCCRGGGIVACRRFLRALREPQGRPSFRWAHSKCLRWPLLQVTGPCCMLATGKCLRGSCNPMLLCATERTSLITARCIPAAARSSQC